MIKDAKGATTVRNTPGSNPYTGGTAIEVTQDKVINLILREENNLLNVNNNNELYCDLQLQNGLKPTDTIPVGRTVGRVLANDGWIKTGTLVCEKTTSGDIVQILYADDGTIWINRGSGWVQLRDRYSLFVTQAEYDALPNSKLTDGNCYIIVDNHKFIINGEEQQLSNVMSVNGQVGDVNTNPICIIQVSSDGYTTTGTITQGEYVDGAIVILTGSGRVTQTGLEITIDGETHNLGILPREGQNGESFSISGMVTGMLKTLVIGGVSSEMFFHWRGGEFNTPA